jgi:hypothetical protein
LTFLRSRPIIRTRSTEHYRRPLATTEHYRPPHGAPMPFDPIAFFVKEIPVSPRTRELMPNVLTLRRNQARGSPKKGKLRGILQIPC